MLVEAAPRDAPWELVARSVFWNRDVSLEAWRLGVTTGHRSYLPDSVKRMSAWNFVRFLGRKTFVEKWPEIREFLQPDFFGVPRLDVAWSYAATGGFNMPPKAARVALPARTREILEIVAFNQGCSIADVAGRSGMPYRQAYGHVSKLVELGLVRKRLDGRGTRRTTRLYTLR